MASIRQRGKKWRVLIRMTGHPTVSATFDSDKEARRWALDTEEKIENGEYVSSPGKGPRTIIRPAFPTFQEAADQHIRLLGIDEKTTTARRIRWWADHFGNRRINEIRKADIQAIVDELRSTPKLYGGTKIRQSDKPRSEVTVTRYLTALSGIFSDHVDPEDGLPYNPARKIKTKGPTPQPIRYKEPDEIKALLEACKASTYPRMYFLAVSALITGARKSELINLTWDRVNVERGEAYLDPENTKTKRARVLIWVGPALDELRKWSMEGGDHLFPSPRYPDRPLVGLQKIWERVCKDAGITMRWHDWRHQCGTELSLAGLNSITVAEILGHSSTLMTQRYTNLATERRREALERAFGNQT